MIQRLNICWTGLTGAAFLLAVGGSASAQGSAEHDTSLRAASGGQPVNASTRAVQAFDCPAKPKDPAARCVAVPCAPQFLGMLGTWKGSFQEYEQSLSKNGKTVFRSYENATTYTISDCMKEVASGDQFIVGRLTDVYPAYGGLPAKSVHSLLIMGQHADGSRYLQTVDSTKQVYTYHLEYENKPASMTAWVLTVPANGQSPEMQFTTIDGRDYAQTQSNTRNVTVTLRVGPATRPYFDNVIAFGAHTLQK